MSVGSGLFVRLLFGCEQFIWSFVALIEHIDYLVLLVFVCWFSKGYERSNEMEAEWCNVLNNRDLRRIVSK